MLFLLADTADPSSPPPYIPLGPALLFLLALVLLVVVIRRRWYAEALLAITAVAAVGCVGYGVVLLQNPGKASDTVGAVLVVGGVALLLGCAIAVRRYWTGRRTSEQ
jgi:MYXO-CTERM domain-containing protein